MAYDPAETERRDQVRGIVGDTGDPPLLTGGEARYDTILTRHAATLVFVEVDGSAIDTGTARAVSEAARALAGQLRLEATSLSSAGESLSYDDRATGLETLAARYAGAALTATSSGPPRFDLQGTTAVPTKAVW